jgi:hypothetical protein
MSGQLHVPAALLSGKQPPVPLARRLGGPQSRSGRCAVDKDLLRLPGIKPIARRYPGSFNVAISSSDHIESNGVKTSE